MTIAMQKRTATDKHTLTPDQRKAVQAEARVCLMTAPAGSGKTEVLIQRIERILNESMYESFRVLVVTFTRKAAEELKARVAQSVGEKLSWRIDANTIHGFAFSWLERAGHGVGISPNVIVFAEKRDRIELLRRFFASAGDPCPDNMHLGRILDMIDRLRTNLGLSTELLHDPIDGTVFRLRELQEIYTTALDSAGGIDYPGMLTKLLELIEIDPAVLGRMQRVYRHILVDEGQDLTGIQAELLRRIVGDKLGLFVVADDRQSINAWAGGGMENAKALVGADYEGLELRHNFRCANQILDVAQHIAHNFSPSRVDTERLPGSAKGQVCYYGATDPDDEARKVADWTDALVLNGIDREVLVPGETTEVRSEDIAVIARTRYALDFVEAELKNRGRQISVQAEIGNRFGSAEERLFHALLEVKANEHSSPAWHRIGDELRQFLEIDKTSLEDRPTLAKLNELVSDSPVACIVEPVLYAVTDNRGLEQLMAKVRESLGSTELKLEQLFDCWQDYQAQTTRNDRSILGLVRYLQRVQQARPSEPGIRLMTTHRSKGLEFRAVAVVGLTQGVFPDYRADNDEMINHERRTFYVAITRASRALLLTWPRVRHTRYGRRASIPSQFLQEAKIESAISSR